MTRCTGQAVFTRTIITMAVLAAVGVAAPTMAASESQYANGATFNYDPEWVGLGNLVGPSDSNCAAASSQPGGSWVQLTFPAFSIPAGNLIQGIEVKLDYETDGSNYVQLHDSGALIGSQGTMPAAPGPSTCDGTSWTTAGSPTEMWGTSLTIADFNAGTIGFRMTQPITTIGSDPGSYPVDIDAAELVVYYGPANSPPTADAGGPYSVNEGGSVSLSGAGSSDPDQSTASLTFEWDLDNDGFYDDATGISPSFSAAGLDGPDSQSIGLRVTDNGALVDTDTATVTINNVAPTISAINASAGSITEGQSVTISGTFSDPGTPDTHTGSALWSDGVSTSVSVVGNTFSTSRSFPDDHPATGTASDGFTVDITITDDDSGSDTETSPVVTVNNVAPSITAINASAASIDEGQSVTVSGTFSDPALGVGTESFSGSALWSDGQSTALSVDGGAGTFTTSRSFADDHPATGTASDLFTVDITVTDDDTGSDTQTSPGITVNNVAPSVDAIVLSSISIDEGQSVTVTGTYSDPALGEATETFSGTATWSDGPSTPLTVNGDGTFETDRFFADDDPATGTPLDNFTVDITIDDDDLGTDTATSGALTVNNVAPTIVEINLSASSIDEGDGAGITVSGTFSDPALGVGTESFTGDALWSDGAVTAVTVVGNTFETSRAFEDDHPMSGTASDIFTVDITITDDDTGSGTDSSPELTVNNVAPTITGSTNSAAECGDTPEGTPVEVSVDFFDPGFGANEDWSGSTIDWGDGFSEAATVATTPGAFGTPTTGSASGSHVYASGGIYTITVTVTDDDTGADTAIETALVTGAGLTPAGLLGVVGTDFLDVVDIQTKFKTDIVVTAGFLGPGKASFPTTDVVSIEVRVCDANDQIHVGQDIFQPGVLIGGPGPDHIRGGTGYSLIEGGPGDDHLYAGRYGATIYGGEGNDDLNGNRLDDMLFGGPGDDRLSGDKGDDLLDGGTGIDDCNPGQGTDTTVDCES